MSEAAQPHPDVEPVDGLRLIEAFIRLSPEARAELLRTAERQAGLNENRGGPDDVDRGMSTSPPGSPN